jgi:predicted SAM-dependent methyltransferase
VAKRKAQAAARGSAATPDEVNERLGVAPAMRDGLLRVDFGGIARGREWLTVNVDAEVRAAPDIQADVTAKANQLGAYFADASIDIARSIHTIEHFESDQIIPTLHYIRKFLKPGAEMIIVVPSMGEIAADYVNGKIPFEVFAAVSYVPGSRVQGRMHELHKWAFDEKLLRWTMQEAGYKNIRLGGDEHWPATWTLDFGELAYTGLVGHYEVKNLIMVGEA